MIIVSVEHKGVDMKFLLAFLILTSFSSFALTTGEKAPEFTLTGIKSKDQKVSLSDFKNKVVVLEWLNYGCPFVKKHYESGNMQNLQKKYTEKDVVWLSIISSAKNKQGHVERKDAIKDKNQNNSAASNVLLDPTGEVGRKYGAKTTPHMYIINKDGILAYQGAIDSMPDTDMNSILSAKNYIATALDELLDGKKITNHTTKSYGCAIKY
jgi:alkyl hydroperoxide reductase subunit AhpC